MLRVGAVDLFMFLTNIQCWANIGFLPGVSVGWGRWLLSRAVLGTGGEVHRLESI